MLIESVLALEVGAAASRIFSSAIWEDRSAQVQASARRGGPSAGAQGQGTQEGLEAQAGWSLRRDSPCTGAGWGAGLGRVFLQGLAPLPLLPVTTRVEIQAQPRQSPEPAASLAGGGAVSTDVNNDADSDSTPG